MARTVGFGIVVATPEEQLLGFGFGSPSSQFDTAAAELWAISFALSTAPFPPTIKTDCKSILVAARAGHDRVTHHTRKLARIWNQISVSLDGSVETLANGSKLIWIPAHLTLVKRCQADHA